MAITSLSEILKTEYDVFLSFRGLDTRQGFTDVLYDHLTESGIQVFRDDDELAIGDTIELILEAINNSKICVPIFSKSFASSAWCLREVAKMMELNKDIVPIFYDVTPNDVKLKTPLYVDQIKEEHQHAGKTQLEEWEKSLVDVGRIKGRELNKTGFVDFIKKFKAEILLKLRVKQKYTIKHLVEMPDEIEEALKLLEIDSIDVRFLGLYGMGGIGKTTLVKTIFNQISIKFDSCCFLANVREERSSKGLDWLQTKLLQDLNPKADISNINISDNWDDKLEKCVRMKSVLIVLDDVGDRSHIRELVGDSISFGLRSRVIITTRDERALLMNVAETSSSGEGRTKMEVKGMNPEQAMLLFSRHAFGRDYPLEDYKILSEDVVSISGGLPLALEVIGSLLYGMSVEAWENKVTNLKTIPPEDVREKLMTSYKALQDHVKEIFLDIACFFIGEEQSNPIYMWKACDYALTWSVQVLVAMSLIKVTDDGKFWMHDQLRDLGREIVRLKNGYNNLACGEGSRIQTYKDALFVHERNKEKQVEGLCLHGSSDDRLADFSNFESLRYLQVAREGAFHHRNFWRLSTDLTWLSMRLNNFNLTAAFKSMFFVVSRNRDNSYLMKLAILDLSWSEITDGWEGWILVQELQRLKVLNLTGCKKLTRTPNFSKMEVLEKLIFYDCSRLAQIDSSIGKLQKLKFLNLGYCYKLKKLPEEVGNLEDVEQIIMTDTCVSKLPDSIGKLKNLKDLDLKGSYRLKKLPESIGLLAKLKYLNLSFCFCLDKLPDSIGDLTSLVSLDMKFCRLIEEFPRSITRLEKLERLILVGCHKVVKLPDELGKLGSSVEVDLGFTGRDSNPESIERFSKGTIYQQKKTRAQMINLARIPPFPSSLQNLTLIMGCELESIKNLTTYQEYKALRNCASPNKSSSSFANAKTLADERPGLESIGTKWSETEQER